LKKTEGVAHSFESTLQTTPGNDAILEVRRVHVAFSDCLVDHAVAAVCTLRSSLEPSSAGFAARYRFTPTDWRIVQHMTKGLTPRPIADAMGVQLSTVRTEHADKG